MSEIEPKKFWVYQNKKYPTIIAFEEEQPKYLTEGYSEFKCLSVSSDLDSYIYFLQHTHDASIKEIKAERDRLRSALIRAWQSLSQPMTEIERRLKCINEGKEWRPWKALNSIQGEK